MDPDFHLTELMSVGGNHMPTIVALNGNEHEQQPPPPQQQQLAQLEPATSLHSSVHMTPSIVGGFDNAIANMNNAPPAPQMHTSHLGESDNPLGSFFEENPDLHVLNAEFVQTSEILQHIPVHESETPQSGIVYENLDAQQNVRNESAQPVEGDVEDDAEDDLEEEVEEEDDNADAGAEENDNAVAGVEEDDNADAGADEDDNAEADAEEDDIDDEEDANEEDEEANEEEEGEAIIPDDGEAILKTAVVTDLDQDKTEDLSNQDQEQDKEQSSAEVVISDAEEPAASSSRASRKQEEEVDENQCRVCCSKEDLVSLFKKIEEKTIADMIMSLCPAVSISIKDFLPQFVCNTCLENVSKAIQLKQQCETTEKELRKKLSRHKNKIRRPVGYVVIDAPLDSGSDEEEPNNDEEFKVSDIASATASEDTESSELSDSKKKKTRSRKRRKSAVTTPTIKSKSKGPRTETISSDDEDNGDPIGNHKRKRSSNSSPETFACEECDQVFMRKQSLILHRKAHANGREPIACKVCGRKFKIKGAYRAHMEKHRDEISQNKCQKCSRSFSSNGELRRHLADDHNQSDALFECSKCKRKFVSSSRLQSHKKQGRCPGIEKGKSKKPEVEAFVVGRDLFKTVAPLTTTYWSDSFSD